MNEPILTILTSIQAVKCKTKIGLRAGMGNGGYTERVLGPIKFYFKTTSLTLFASWNTVIQEKMNAG